MIGDPCESDTVPLTIRWSALILINPCQTNWLFFFVFDIALIREGHTMQEIWTRDDMKHLKSWQSKLINKSILLPSQSVLPNLIQFYFYPCFCMLQKLITSTLIIRLPYCSGHLWGKWKSTAGNRIWPLVTAMIMKTIGNLNPHWENHPPLPSIFFFFNFHSAQQ